MADELPLGTEQNHTAVWLRSPPTPPTLLTLTQESDDFPEVVPCTQAQHEALLTQMWPHEHERRILEWIVDVADKRTGDRCIDFYIDRAENASHNRLRDVRETAQRMLLRHEAVCREYARGGSDSSTARRRCHGSVPGCPRGPHPQTARERSRKYPGGRRLEKRRTITAPCFVF